MTSTDQSDAPEDDQPTPLDLLDLPTDLAEPREEPTGIPFAPSTMEDY